MLLLNCVRSTRAHLWFSVLLLGILRGIGCYTRMQVCSSLALKWYRRPCGVLKDTTLKHVRVESAASLMRHPAQE